MDMEKGLVRFRGFLATLFSIVLVGNLLMNPVLVLADEIDLPTRLLETGNGGKSILVPEWDQISFGSLLPVQSSGSAGDRSWEAGQSLSEILTLGDISPSLSAELLTEDAIAQFSELDPTQAALESFPLVGEQTLSQLASAVPQLSQTSISSIPPVSELLQAKGFQGFSSQSLGNVLSTSPTIGNLKLKEIDLSNFKVASIPNLQATELKQFTGWQKTVLQDVPGLSSLPLANFPNPVAALGGIILRIDMIYGTAESRRNNTISGSNIDGFQVPCDKNCAHIELDDLENVGRSQRGPLEGKQWISGKYQKVNGGSGCLAWVNGGKEPTGRHPFGKAFKVVVMEPDETTDTVDTALYFRFASFCGSTPYILGPVPFFSYDINSPIFVGLLNSNAAVSSLQSNFSGLAAAEQGAAGVTPPAVGASGYVANSSNVYQPSNQPKLGLVQGVNLDLQTSSMNTSSETAGDYNAVGPYVCEADGVNCGRSLGKYQNMSYDSNTVATISAKPGGTEFLTKLKTKNYNPTESELFQYFPPSDQDVLFKQGLTSKLAVTSQQPDPSTNQPFTGSRLIERVVQKYAGGDYSKVDSTGSDGVGQLTLAGYSKEVGKRYLAAGGVAPSTNTTAAPHTPDSNQKITQAIAHLGDFSTRNIPGTSGGATASMAAVNKVLVSAGYKPLDKGTLSIEQAKNALIGGRGEAVSTERSQPGDLVFFDAGGIKQVVGICATKGCSSYRMNTPSESKFTVVAANKLTGKGALFEGKSPAIYRLKN